MVLTMVAQGLMVAEKAVKNKLFYHFSMFGQRLESGILL